VGLTFRKSISLPGGFRINLSKSGIGASWGVPGFRVGTGPNGPRFGVSVPGTGLGWTTSLGGGHPEQAARALEHAPAGATPGASQLVADHERRLAWLASFHREASSPLDWNAIAAAPPPAPPAPTTPDALASYQWWNRLARGVLAGDREAYEAAIEYLSPLPRLSFLGASIEATAREPWLAEARFHANGREVVPPDALSLTKTGKLSTKKIGVVRSWALYQDHVSSAALRIARELLALLPFHLVLVHARVARLDTATGHDEERTVLSAAFPREDMAALDFTRLDPSDALERFPHTMDFSSRTGFSPVDEVGLDDLPREPG
jgi:hypothetical protein